MYDWLYKQRARFVRSERQRLNEKSYEVLPGLQDWTSGIVHLTVAVEFQSEAGLKGLCYNICKVQPSRFSDKVSTRKRFDEAWDSAHGQIFMRAFAYLEKRHGLWPQADFVNRRRHGWSSHILRCQVTNEEWQFVASTRQSRKCVCGYYVLS